MIWRNVRLGDGWRGEFEEVKRCGDSSEGEERRECVTRTECQLQR